MSTALRAAAGEYIAAGLSSIPIANLQHKRPAVEWKRYQTDLPTAGDTALWWGANIGLAIVCGHQGLTVIDFDSYRCPGLYEEWCQSVDELAPGLRLRLPTVTTQNQGTHLYLLCDEVDGSTKLASSAPYQQTDRETGEITRRQDTWIETRGLGGYVLAPPTPGYVLTHGSLLAVPRISGPERALLLSVAQSLTEDINNEPEPAQRASGHADEDTPGNAYNADTTAAQLVGLLETHGWRVAYQRGHKYALTRPGKDTREGISATIRTDRDVPIFYSFSTSVADLPVQRGLSPFQVYTFLEHGGDFKAAARALAAQGYGTPAAPVLTLVQRDRSREESRSLTESQRSLTEPKIRLYSIQEMIDLPTPEMLIAGILPANAVSILYSAPGVGKSFVAIDMAIRVALGMSWFGLKVLKGDVLYVAAERATGLPNRLRAWFQENGMPPPDNFRFIKQPIYPTHEGTATAVLEALEYYGMARPALIVLDTLARCNDGDENSTTDMSRLVAAVDLIREQTGASILIAHHQGHTEGRMRGSTALAGAADAVLSLTADKESGVITLRCEKMSDTEDFEPWRLVLKKVWLEDKSSCVVGLASSNAITVPAAMRAVLEALAAGPLDGLTFGELLAQAATSKATLARTLQDSLKYGVVHARETPRAAGRKYTILEAGKRALKLGEYQPNRSESHGSLTISPRSLTKTGQSLTESHGENGSHEGDFDEAF